MEHIGIDGTLFTGKSSIIHALFELGYWVVPESARPLILRAENDILYANCVPWIDFDWFQEEVAKKQIALYAVIAIVLIIVLVFIFKKKKSK